MPLVLTAFYVSTSKEAFSLFLRYIRKLIYCEFNNKFLQYCILAKTRHL